MSSKQEDKKMAMARELFSAPIKDAAGFASLKRRLAKRYSTGLLHNSRLIAAYRQLVQSEEIKSDPKIEALLKVRAVRTLSGIAPVAVLTKPWPCPGKCAYCPNIKDVPTSYLPNEPAVMRAIHCGYDPYEQVSYRLRALEANGHDPTKIELIVIGGTWSALPEKYQYWYIKECFRAANDFEVKSKKSKVKRKDDHAKSNIEILKKQLISEQKKNETARYQIIGVTLETRPDYITDKELWRMRELGCTRVELGVQVIDDRILKLNRRGHGVAAIAEATLLLKDFGFKVTYHLMPGLPGSDKERDVSMFKQLFSDERFQPDQIKFYPTVVTKGSLLYRWWRTGKYQPYGDSELESLIAECKAAVPPYVRIIRLIRDIPGESIEAGNKITNLRQIMQQRGIACRCIRCREVKSGRIDRKDLQLFLEEYPASGGREIFLSFENSGQKTLYGFCRLRLPSSELFPGTALVRELHVYGQLVPVGESKAVQHAGLGKKLLAQAEKIARQNGYRELAIISGVGVRGYYRKLGYRLRRTYLLKKLK